MPDSGPLMAQQRFAAEEPYQNIEQYDQKLRSAINAWQVGSSISQRWQQMQNQLAWYAIRGQAMEERANQREEAMRIAQDRVGLYGQAVDIRQQAEERKNQQYADRIEGAQGILQADQAARARGVSPGDPTWPTVYNEELMKAGAYKAGSAAFNVAQRQMEVGQNNSIDNQLKINNMRYNAWKDNVASRLYPGTSRGTYVDIRPATNPELYKDETTTRPLTWSEWAFGVPKGQEPVPQATGNKIIPMQNAQGKQLPPKIIPAKDLMEMNREYQNIMNERSRIPTKINDPLLGVYSAVPIPDKSQLRVDQPYLSPQGGTVRWTGTGFVPWTGNMNTPPPTNSPTLQDDTDTQ